MNERELGKALLRWETTESATPALDPRQVTAQILRRDRRRVWQLAALTALLWIIVGVGFLIATYFYLEYVHPQVAVNLRDGATTEAAATWDRIIRYVAYWLCGVFVMFLLAAFFTVLLVFYSRRTTIRHVNAGLSEISEQLKQLRATPERYGAGTTPKAAADQPSGVARDE